MGNQNMTVKCPQCDSQVTEESRFCPECGFLLKEQKQTLTYTPHQEQLIEDTLHFDPGESFGSRYRIIEEIGRGGMGMIYKAEDKELNINVALKMIRPEYSSNTRFIQKFKEETLLARSISHENVIRIHDIGDVDEIKFISMDHIKGQSLKELIQTSGMLAVETTINITKQLCQGLGAAHKKGIVHQDLKPRNVMIDSDGKAYITDFGIAKSLAIHDRKPSKEVMGTPPYLSPEQAKKEKVDQRSDIYSLGIIIYEMLTGKRPFDAATASEYIAKHIRETPSSPSDTNPLIPPFLDKIILKCLEKDPRQRYQSTEEILKDIKEHVEDSRGYIPQPKSKHLWKWTYFIPIILIAVTAFYFLRERIKPTIPVLPETEKISIAVMYFENNTGDNNLNYWGKTLSNLITYDLAQSKLIRVLTADRLYTILEELDLLKAESYSSEDLRKVAERGRVNYIVHGNYSMAEESFRIAAMLHNVRAGEIVDSTKVSGEGMGSFHSMVDDLTPWIKSQFNLTSSEIAADFDRNIEEITTSSTIALQHYTQGIQYYQEGKYQESNNSFKEAVRIDPEFAIAYKRISENYSYLDDFDQARKYAETALSVIHHISEREQYLVKGFAYTILEDSYERAINNYKKMLQLYPDDEDGNIYLGAIYRNMEEWDLALQYFNKILQWNPVIVCENIIRFYMAKGSYEKAREILKANENDFYNPGLFRRLMSQIYLCQGKLDAAIVEIENAIAIEPENAPYKMWKGIIYHIQGNFQAAEDIFQQFINSSDLESRLSGRSCLAYLYLSRGQHKDCRNEIRQGIKESEKHRKHSSLLSFLKFLSYLNLQTGDFENSFQVSERAEEIALDINQQIDVLQSLHLCGLISLETKKMDDAADKAEQIKQFIEETGAKKFMRYYFHLKGMISKNKNMWPQAIEDLEKAASLLSDQHEYFDEHAFFLYPLALAYYQSGDIDNAQQRFEKIVGLTTGRLFWGGIYAKSHYWLGKIYQEKGWIGKAIENHEKFLRLWSDADPGLREVTEAEKHMEHLKGAFQK